jgi:hypothetical protein
MAGRRSRLKVARAQISSKSPRGLIKNATIIMSLGPKNVIHWASRSLGGCCRARGEWLGCQKESAKGLGCWEANSDRGNNSGGDGAGSWIDEGRWTDEELANCENWTAVCLNTSNNISNILLLACWFVSQKWILENCLSHRNLITI